MRLAVIGAGGHAKVVVDTIRLMESMVVPLAEACLVDPDPEKAGRSIMGLPVLASVANLKPNLFIVAIGDNRLRRKCFDEMLGLGWQAINAIHPTAAVSPGATIGRGVLVGPNAVINCDATIGDNVIINSAAVIEHDCRVGDHSHIAPRSVLGGNVRVGNGALVGIGSTVCPGLAIGEWSILGAGAVLLDPLPDESTAVGVPARAKKGT